MNERAGEPKSWLSYPSGSLSPSQFSNRNTDGRWYSALIRGPGNVPLKPQTVLSGSVVGPSGPMVPEAPFGGTTVLPKLLIGVTLDEVNCLCAPSTLIWYTIGSLLVK